ncbi:MAG: hypothetical protein ACYC1M_00450 [Armatimonadota bacterium]
MVYSIISVITLFISATLLYAIQVLGSGLDGSLRNTPVINGHWIASYFLPMLVFILLGCATRRYWLVFIIVYVIQTLPVAYIFVGAAMKGHLIDNGAAKFGITALYGLLMVFALPGIFWGLCKLAGIPTPQNNGWRDYIKEDCS